MAGQKCQNFLQQSHSSPEIQDELYLVVLLLVKESSSEETGTPSRFAWLTVNSGFVSSTGGILL